MRFGWAGLLGVLLSSCVASNAVQCADGDLCANGKVCDVQHHGCVTQQQLDDCATAADGSGCTIGKTDTDPGTPGSCHEGVCLPASCGNGRVDVDEVCDDGNTADHDTCSSDCKSDESCGNRVVDTDRDEQCDDGNTIDNDGCSSTCKTERPHWFVDPLVPPPHLYASSTYDPIRRTIVMYGGELVHDVGFTHDNSIYEWRGVWRPSVARKIVPRAGVSVAFEPELGAVVAYGAPLDGDSPSETWLWDGATWTQGADAPPRYGAGLAYDERRKILVAAGGTYDLLHPATETIEFDGTAWKALAIPGPAERTGPAMAYDAIAQKVVLVGGQPPNPGIGLRPIPRPPDPYSDTWIYDGAWHEVAESGAPAIAGASLAYSPRLGKLVLFGGNTGPNDRQVSSTTYTWSGTKWVALGGANPPGRYGATLVRDEAGRLHLFGGSRTYATAAADMLDDEWVFDETGWHDRTTERPLRRTGAIAIPAGAFGGLAAASGADAADFSHTLVDTWRLGVRGWTQAAAAGAPSLRLQSYAAAEDGTALVFGGIDQTAASPPSNDLHRWDGHAWSLVTQAAPPRGRDPSVLVRDPVRHVYVLFGGVDQSGTLLDDTWEYDGSAWRTAQPAHPLAYSIQATGGFDPVTRRVLVVDVAGTHAWDGTDWTTVDAAAHRFAGVAVDPARGRLVGVTQGDAVTNASVAFEWDGAAWRRIDALEQAPDIVGRLAVTFDGTGVAAIEVHDPTTELVELRWVVDDAPRPAEVCVMGVDHDGDGKAGCADGDCALACGGCGNGACDPLEDCASCAADCGACE